MTLVWKNKRLVSELMVLLLLLIESDEICVGFYVRR